MNIPISHHINPDFSPPTERSGSEGLRFCRNYQMEELPASHDSLALRKGNNIRRQPGNDEAVGSGFWNHLGKVRLEAPTLKPTSPKTNFLDSFQKGQFHRPLPMLWASFTETIRRCLKHPEPEVWDPAIFASIAASNHKEGDVERFHDVDVHRFWQNLWQKAFRCCWLHYI